MNYQLGWWYALAQIISSEAISAYQDLSGYDSFVEESNLADVLSYIAPDMADYDSSDTYYRFKDGYQSLATKLYNQLVEGSCRIFMGKGLISLSSTEYSNDKQLLEFNDKSRLHAKYVILALPQRAIKLLESTNSQLELVRGALDSVFPVPAFKLFLVFDNPWWIKFGFDTGVMHTTLPFRKLYYWSFENSTSSNNTNAVVMATY
jgi:monoamine oxidase